MNAASSMPLNAKSKLMHFVHRGFRRVGLDALSNRIDNANRTEVPPMDAETRSYLESVYREQNEQLADLLDMDFSSWASNPSSDEPAAAVS